VPAVKKRRDQYPMAGGFTLAELAVVLVIVSLLIGGLLVPLSAQIDQRNYNETQQQISEIREALIGFAVVNGRLPLTGNLGNQRSGKSGDLRQRSVMHRLHSLVNPRGQEDGRMEQDHPVQRQSGVCRFSICLEYLGSKKVQTRDGAGNATYLIGANACSVASPCAPAVIYSAGKNNFGFADDGTPLPNESANNADEVANAGVALPPPPPVFFSRDRYTVPVGGEFDDIVVWIPPYLLFNRMVSAGKLP
jgi:type II secretory pathway pseudopilin PulG